ncbi:DUF1501 domain-containing protein [Fimbriiglobus ruber]|uniref:DUF1501 domain-containing protein n=1 Tax=Fimbriiglobus ruber TaxID=1908690 RepID=A0A225E0H7_9BACT|nr:DUF1501 domain-containing protein [Fimbriiglobus ruber]OWK47101.1 hypothetical protein FRUB_00800 [Fimbriiglobus ruber]
MLTRRDWLRLTAAGALGASASGWLPALASTAAHDPKRKRSCILLWMSGGPSQIDTFDPKPGTDTGGPFKAIDTAVPGIRVTELLPTVAGQMKHLTVVRSMATKEGDHGRATYQLRTGYAQQEPLQYPTLGSLVSKELGDPAAELPGFVSIASRRGLNDGGFGAGYLGANYAPLLIGNSDNDPYVPTPTARALAVPDLKPGPGVSLGQAEARLTLLGEQNAGFAEEYASAAVSGVSAAYDRAVRLMKSPARAAFDLDDEPAALRDRYGRNLFGQGCLLARRLVERNVPFIEVFLGRVPGAFGGWDTHAKNFDALKALCGILDPAWGTLMADLTDRGLIDTTAVVWMGEFGRTPRINGGSGRDHYPTAWSVVLGGGGIKGGQVVGKTDKTGGTVEDRPVAGPDLLATVCAAIGVDPTKQHLSNIGRPIRVVEKNAKPIAGVVA